MISSQFPSGSEYGRDQNKDTSLNKETICNYDVCNSTPFVQHLAMNRPSSQISIESPLFYHPYLYSKSIYFPENEVGLPDSKMYESVTLRRRNIPNDSTPPDYSKIQHESNTTTLNQGPANLKSQFETNFFEFFPNINSDS
ncbi:hypothetical protein HZS_1763 [Henneguya salminicola]|nr:hypothetical protein HZS_1763 [Henneguya salminicola]